jgi:hypothetical protein
MTAATVRDSIAIPALHAPISYRRVSFFIANCSFLTRRDARNRQSAAHSSLTRSLVSQSPIPNRRQPLHCSFLIPNSSLTRSPASKSPMTHRRQPLHCSFLIPNFYPPPPPLVNSLIRIYTVSCLNRVFYYNLRRLYVGTFKTAKRFFSMRFLGVFSLFRFPLCLKTAFRPVGGTAIQYKKCQARQPCKKARAGVSEKMRVGPFGRETLVFSADRPRPQILMYVLRWLACVKLNC